MAERPPGRLSAVGQAEAVVAAVSIDIQDSAIGL